MHPPKALKPEGFKYSLVGANLTWIGAHGQNVVRPATAPEQYLVQALVDLQREYKNMVLACNAARTALSNVETAWNQGYSAGKVDANVDPGSEMTDNPYAGF